MAHGGGDAQTQDLTHNTTKWGGWGVEKTILAFIGAGEIAQLVKCLCKHEDLSSCEVQLLWSKSGVSWFSERRCLKTKGEGH